jgi:hypothetical protein
VLAKPFEPQMVISRVKELLARPAAEAPGPAPADGLAAFAPEMRIAAPVVAAVPAANADATAKLDEYFDQLDSAFARFTNVQPVKPSDIAPAVAADATPAELDWFGPPPASEPAGLDPSLFLQPASMPSGLQLPDSAELVREVHALKPPAMAARVEAVAAVPQKVAVPESVEEPTPVLAHEPAAYTQAAAPSEPVAQLASVAVGEQLVVVPVVPTLPRELPSIGDAFAAILAAEQADPAVSSAWPSPEPAAAAPAITDELVDRVSRRVIEQLTDRVVREAVADAVSGIAERLVREEIERIKKAIG